MAKDWPGDAQTFWEAVYDNYTIWSVEQKYPFIDYKHPATSIARVKAQDLVKSKKTQFL
jgi:hypothetical protein